MGASEFLFRETVAGLLAGDSSRLAPLFANDTSGNRCTIIKWYEQGLFANEPQALAEALSCACFNGFASVAEIFLKDGVNPEAGNGTGMNSFHWAANRGQLEVVSLLLRYKTPLETRNMYGGTVLGSTVWSAIHEPRKEHLKIIEALLEAGARVEEVEFHTGNEAIDELLRRYGTKD